MTRVRPLLALIFALGLLAAGCPDDVEEAIQQDDPDDPIELVRQAAGNTLGEGTAEATITVASADHDPTVPDGTPDTTDDDTTTTDDETTTTEDDDAVGADDDTTGTDDDTTGTDDLDVADTDTEDELRIQSEEDFGQELRRLAFDGGAQTLGDAEDATTSEILVDGTWIYVPLGEPGPAPAPTPEDDDTVGTEDDEATTDDDTVTDDDSVTTDETIAENWGRFDLSWLDEDQTDAGDDTEFTTTTNEDLRFFPFRDPHAILVILENAEGEATQGDGTDDAAVTEGTSYEVTLDVDETAPAAGDAGIWLERRAAGQDTFSVTVWIDDDERIVGVQYEIGGGTADDTLGTTTDDDTTTEDETTATDEDTTATDDDTAATETDDDVAATDEATPGDLNAQDELIVTIEYTQFGIDLEIDVPNEDRADEIDEQELSRHLPALPTSHDADQLTPTPEATP